MNEDMILQETENNEVSTTYVEPETSTETSSDSGVGKKLFLFGAGALAAAAVYLYKTKDKRKQRKIDKLIKEGYVVYKPEDTETPVEVIETDFTEVTEE